MSKYHEPELKAGQIIKTVFTTDTVPGVRPMTPGYFIVGDAHQSFTAKFSCMVYALLRCTKEGRIRSTYIHPMSAEFIDGKIRAGEASIFSPLWHNGG